MRWLGDVSYGVFLWHQPMILVVRRHLRVVHEKGDASFALMLTLLPARVVLNCGMFRWRLTKATVGLRVCVKVKVRCGEGEGVQKIMSEE